MTPAVLSREFNPRSRGRKWKKGTVPGAGPPRVETAISESVSKK